MSYADTTLAPLSGYTYVHTKQIYDTLAAQLTAHSAWSFVESVDQVVTTTTSTRYVWKCSAVASGLPNDFYIAFLITFTTIGPVYQTVGALQVYLFERYNSTTHTASYPAGVVTSSAVVVNSDNAHPATWVLNATPPSTPTTQFFYTQLAPSSNTAYRMLSTLSAGTLVVIHPTGCTYVGMFESLLGSTLDPMPLAILGSGGAATGGATTRHPMITGSTVHVFRCVSNSAFGTSANVVWNDMGAGPVLIATATTAGQLGAPADTGGNMFMGGAIPVSKCVLTMGSSSVVAGVNASTRGSLRGYFRHVVSGNPAPYSYGDTFSIDGKAYTGIGIPISGLQASTLMDTTA